ncbi:unnamed protein product [Sphagnum compactum]
MLQSISAARARALQGSLRLRAAGASSKGGAAKSKKSRASDAPAAPVVSKELREKAVLGANLLKDGSDPQILPDSEYPEWLNGMLEKRPPLSELQRRKPETMSLPELMRLLKLDNRRRIKQNNGLKAKT